MMEEKNLLDEQEKACRCCVSKVMVDNHSSEHEHEHGCCEDGHCHEHEEHEHSHNLKSEKINLIISSALFLVLMVLDNLFEVKSFSKYIYIALYIFCGFSVIKEAIISIKEKDFFNEFTLMFLATSGAIAIGEYPEAVGVMLFYKIGEYMQESVATKSRNSIKELMLSRPEKGNLIKGKEIIEVSVEDIKIGDNLLVKAGEKIPTDGVIVKGETNLDTSSITGEFMPVAVSEGDEVLGGVINISNVVTIKATKEFKDTSISRVMDLVENSSKNKAPTEKFISKFARYYTPVVFFTALLVATIPPLFFEGQWNEWIYRSLVMLVISCPCALLISVPLSYFASIGFSSKSGMLVKGGVVMDAAKSITMAVFDKTGTLTEGKLSIEKVVPQSFTNKEDLLELARYIEQFSNHPIAKAIIGEAVISHDSKAVVEDVSGKGLIVKKGKDVLLAGKKKFLEEQGILLNEAKEIGTLVYIAKNGVYQGHIVLNDSIKKEAKSMISSLKKAKIKTMMLTGDNEASAEYVASKLGIDSYKAGLLPEDKLAEVQILKDSENVMFIGDGTNDAPVLANAKLGIAMGGVGSKLAIEVSDIVIVNDDISKVSKIIDIAKKTNVVVWQNIIFALGVKTLFMVLGATGLSGLWEAVFADVGVSILAVLNAIRLIR